jgi:hypothetical protein
MSFKKENWETRTGQSKGACVRTFSYWNEDGDVLTGAGYFPNLLGLRDGDMVEVIPADSATKPSWLKIAVSNGVATATNAA